MIVEQVTKRTFADTTGAARRNIGAICLPHFSVMVDSGLYPSLAQEFRIYVEKATLQPVTTLILTHYHGDHVFGNQVFKDCQIIANPAVVDRMEEMAVNQWTRQQLEEAATLRPETYGQLDLDTLQITHPTSIFHETLILTDEGHDVIIQKVGGHTAGSTYVYLPEDHVLFAGDLIFAHTFPWGGDPTVDPDHWIAALKKFQQMAVQKIIPGHGPVCDLREIQAYLEFFEHVVRKIKEFIMNGRTLTEVVEYTGYPPFYPSETPERRRDTLAQWYRVYKNKIYHPSQ